MRLTLIEAVADVEEEDSKTVADEATVGDKMSSAGSLPEYNFAGRGGNGGAGVIFGTGGSGGTSDSGSTIYGDNGNNGYKTYAEPNAGGLGQGTLTASAGDAIHKNGNNVTIVAGVNDNQVKGDVV